MIGNVDGWAYNSIAGWAADKHRHNEIISVELRINGKTACRILAQLYREDLKEAGVGHGSHGFSIDPRPYFTEGFNHLELRIADTDVVLGTRKVVINMESMEICDLFQFSQMRWKGDEPPEGLTWGRPMTGDSFVDMLRVYWCPNDSARVVEVGPGYGRILSTLLQREIPFGTYCGIEISATRVARLRQQFIDKRVQFECGDINSYRFHQPADVVISSATFVHFYPDCLNALKNIRSQISPTALIAIDFIDPTHYSTSRGFDSASGTYVVGYTRDELREIFSAAGYDVIAMPEFVIGLGAAGDVFGLLVIARPVVHNSLPTNVVGHRIVLTGVSQGIGEAMARQCLDAGWTVEAIGRSRPPWPDRNGFSFHLADLRNLDEVNFALSKIRGPIDVLVNNAAAAGWNSQTFRDFSPEDFQETFQLNTVVPIYIARRLEEQLSQGAQKLVVMVSTANASISSNSTPNMLAYKSSKSALNQAVRTIAAEWVGSDKTVVALSPGWARTAMGGESAPLSPDEAAAQILRFIFNNLWVGRSGLFISIDGSPQPW